MIHDASFQDFGHLLFTVNLNVDEAMSLKEGSSSSTYLWYSNIQSEKTLEIVNYLKQQLEDGN